MLMVMISFSNHPHRWKKIPYAKREGEPGLVKYEYPHESTLLQTVNQLITKYGNDPHYKVKSKETTLFGYSIEDLKKIRGGIYEKKKGNSISFETASGRKAETKTATPTQKVKNLLQAP